ncbi:hypothetical protein MIND_00269600 [Mycena indigotica]|uniref:Uncharacterized protein n=1 Tax=Mycena indigotica TaxID=2126181 RepID=A0A8H6WDJ3_9AGAR|nr:uncharacterized protein MIND_00269600 [Mycena indigotica]KAF7312556.1 hypothetical protein MIND_00269600 [Mycena indigotica]
MVSGSFSPPWTWYPRSLKLPMRRVGPRKKSPQVPPSTLWLPTILHLIRRGALRPSAPLGKTAGGLRHPTTLDYKSVAFPLTVLNSKPQPQTTMSFTFETRSPVETARLAAKHCDFKTSLPSVPTPAPFVPEMLATIRHTPKRLRRLSHAGVDHIRRRKQSGEEPEDFAAPPEFAIPDYKEATTPVEEVSPLAVEGSVPKQKRSRRSSAASSVSSEASSTLPRSRRSSVTSVAESFSSNKETVTLVMKAKAFPRTLAGFFSSLVCLIAAFIGLSLVKPAPHYQEPPPRPRPSRVAAANERGDERRPSLFKRLWQKCKGSFKSTTPSKAPAEAPAQLTSSPAKKQAPAVLAAWRPHMRLPTCQWRRHLKLVSKLISAPKLRNQQQQPEAAHPAPAIVC